MLEIRQLTKRFGDVSAVRSVSLDVPAGQMVGVIGRSGAGKSTLLRMCNRLEDPSEGEIRFDGRVVSALRGRALLQWRSRCAMIFQQFNLVPRLDVLTNVLLGRIANHGTVSSLFKRFTEAERTMAILALERLDMADQALQRAAGIEPAGHFGQTVFSGGHEQSVIGVLNGTLDPAFTWTSKGDNTGQLRMMMDRGMLKREDLRVVWESPVIPNPPYVIPSNLPEDMKRDIAEFFLALHKERPEIADAAASGRTSGFVPATHAMYAPVVDAVQEMRTSRRQR